LAHGRAQASASQITAAALLPIGLLLLWQMLTYGSPLVSGYQAAGAAPTGNGEIAEFFSPNYITGLPMRTDTLRGSEDLPNLPRYLLWLAGDGLYLALPGVALAGAAWQVRFARRPGRDGAVARYGLCIAFLTLAVYIPYFWQGARFLLGAAALLNLAGALAVIDVYDLLVSRYQKSWSKRVVP
jgi:hypothetical protein